MKTKMFKKIAFLSIVSMVFNITGCRHKSENSIKKQIKCQDKNNMPNKSQTLDQKNICEDTKKEKDVITIWVHGTKSARLQDHVFKNFFFSLMDLQHISQYKDNHTIKHIAQVLCEKNTERFVYQNFYTFGWSGQLSHKARKDAAIKLHKSILQLKKEYFAAHGVFPKIRLITHSHGGNVALNMAKYNSKVNDKISIYELVMLACPVQQKTAKYLSLSLFEKAYSLYSEIDILQVIDPQGLHKHKNKEQKPFFSERRFTPEEKLTQANVKINNRNLMHVEFITEKFANLLPDILNELDSWEKQEKLDSNISKINDNKKTKNNKEKKEFKCLKIKTGKNSAKFERKYIKRK